MIDHLLFAAVRPLVGAWSRITGRSNFTFARVLLGAYVLAISAAALLFAHTTSPSGGGATMAIYAVLVTWVVRRYSRDVRKVEEIAEEAAQLGAFPARAIEVASDHRWGRAIWFSLAPLPLVTSADDSVAGALLISASHVLLAFVLTAAWEFDPGGRSVFARIREKVAALVLTPAPVPAGAGR